MKSSGNWQDDEKRLLPIFLGQGIKMSKKMSYCRVYRDSIADNVDGGWRA
jgi:hypothetical protein